MYSYIPVLKKYLELIKPKNIIEWGPGKSTQIILDNTDNECRIVSIEHDQKYYDLNKPLLKDSRLSLKLISNTRRCSNYAVEGLKHGPIDLAFVDGRRRVECCFAAMLSLNENGVILLHDCSRKNYTDLLLPFIDVIETSHDTLVFRKKSF